MKIVQVNRSNPKRFCLQILDEQGNLFHAFGFDSQEEVNAFMNGWRCNQSVVNRLVQRLPQTIDLVIAG